MSDERIGMVNVSGERAVRLTTEWSGFAFLPSFNVVLRWLGGWVGGWASNGQTCCCRLGVVGGWVGAMSKVQ